jgi:hypothetical protein
MKWLSARFAGSSHCCDTAPQDPAAEGLNPLTHHGLLWPSPPSSGWDPNLQKAQQFHDSRPL